MKKFAKGEQLLAADLNALAGGLEELQAAPRGKAGSMRGHATYGHAWYNVTGADGTVLNAPGVLAGVCYVSGIDEPCIEDGVMKLLPPSGGGGGECSCVLAQYNVSGVDDTPGKIASVRFAAVSQPQISDGGMQLPLAHATVAEDGTVATGVAGALAGVEVVDPAKPWIDSGTLKLPLAGAISGVEYAGLIKKVEYVSGIDEPEIDCGVLRLPLQRGGMPDGLRDMYGNTVAWDALPAADNAIILSTHYVGSYKYDLKAWRADGFLSLQVIQDFTAS